MSEQEMEKSQFIASLGKGMQVLEAFGTERQRLNVSQVAQKTQISRTAVRRYLLTFAD